MEFPSNQQHNLNIDMIQWDKDNQCLALLSVSVCVTFPGSSERLDLESELAEFLGGRGDGVPEGQSQLDWLVQDPPSSLRRY